MTWEATLSGHGRQIDDALMNDRNIINELTNEKIRLTNENIRIDNELQAAKVEIARLMAIINGGPVDPPPVDPPPAGALRFKPPVLMNPMVIDITLGQGIPATLDTKRDYIIKLPKNAPYMRAGTGLNLVGGNNIVIIGGDVVVSSSGGVCRALYAKDNKGVVHIEGVRFKPAAGNFTEGINMSCPDATIQIQNCWEDGLVSGSQATNHADIIQTWNGPKTLRVDGLKGRSNYQGAFLNARDTNTAAQPLDNWELHRLDFEMVDAKYALWLVPPPANIKQSKIHCWGKSLGARQPELWQFSTDKPTEDFAPGAGMFYVSPGYINA